MQSIIQLKWNDGHEPIEDINHVIKYRMNVACQDGGRRRRWRRWDSQVAWASPKKSTTLQNPLLHTIQHFNATIVHWQLRNVTISRLISEFSTQQLSPHYVADYYQCGWNTTHTVTISYSCLIILAHHSFIHPFFKWTFKLLKRH